MQVIKVDGTVFLGERDEKMVVDALSLGSSNLAADLTKNQVATYVMKENLLELTTVEFGTTSAVMARDLTEDELQLFALAEFAMDGAKRRAVRNLENQVFAGTFGGK